MIAVEMIIAIGEIAEVIGLIVVSVDNMDRDDDVAEVTTTSVSVLADGDWVIALLLSRIVATGGFDVTAAVAAAVCDICFFYIEHKNKNNNIIIIK